MSVSVLSVAAALWLSAAVAQPVYWSGTSNAATIQGFMAGECVCSACMARAALDKGVLCGLMRVLSEENGRVRVRSALRFWQRNQTKIKPKKKKRKRKEKKREKEKRNAKRRRQANEPHAKHGN